MDLAAEFLLWLLILFTNHNPIYSRLWYNMFPHRPFFFLIYDLLALLATLLSLTNLKTNAVKWKGKNHPVQSVSYLFCMIRILIYWRPGISFQYPHFSTLNSLNWLPTIPLSAIIDDGWPYTILQNTLLYFSKFHKLEKLFSRPSNPIDNLLFTYCLTTPPSTTRERKATFMRLFSLTSHYSPVPMKSRCLLHSTPLLIIQKLTKPLNQTYEFGFTRHAYRKNLKSHHQTTIP